MYSTHKDWEIEQNGVFPKTEKMKTKSVCQETIVKEYDEELTSCQEVVESEGLAGTKANKYQIIGDLLYYVSSED